jgi:hypothetical protein
MHSYREMYSSSNGSEESSKSGAIHAHSIADDRNEKCI